MGASYDKQLRNISAYPIDVGDILILVDIAKEARHKLEIQSIERVSETIRKLSALVIDSTSEEMKKTKTITFTLDAEVEVMGIVLKPKVQDGRVSINKVQENKAIAQAMCEFLATMDDQGAQTKVVRNYLISSGFLPPDEDKSHRRMLSIAKNRKDLFISTGGWIYNVDDPVLPTTTNIGKSSHILIDWDKLTKGLKLILTSISCVKLTNDDK